MKVLLLSNNPNSQVLADRLRDQAGEEVIMFPEILDLGSIGALNPDFIISFNYRFIVKRDVIERFPMKLINLHASFLPWNRGASPNMWSFLEDTPKGVTIHCMAEKVDTGDILVQEELHFDEAVETFRSSYEALQRSLIELLLRRWDEIKIGQIEPSPQQGTGSSHTVAESNKVFELFQPDGWDTRILDAKNIYRRYLNSL